nr:MAG TPA: hypothetical protein [Caudoviricetes sp.]
MLQAVFSLRKRCTNYVIRGIIEVVSWSSRKEVTVTNILNKGAFRWLQ